MKRRWRKLYEMGTRITCPYCLRQLPMSEMTIEHEPPKSRQKELGPSKILISCKECNHKKGALTAEEFAEWKHLEFIRNGGLSR